MEESGEKTVEALITDLESDREEVRREAVAQLARVGDRRALEPLKRLTNDVSVSIRFSARKAVAAIEKRVQSEPEAPSSPAAAPAADLAAWRQRLSSPDPQARLRAVLDTYDARMAELLPILSAMLASEGEPTVRSALASAVGRYRDPASLPALFRALEDPDSRVRANAVDALGRFRDPGVIEHLSRLAGDPDNRVQANLARALGQFDPQFLHDQVSAMLSSGTPWMRESALYILWAVRDEWCKAELDFIGNDSAEDPEFREKARRFPAGLMRLSRSMSIEAARSSGAAPPAPGPAYEAGFEVAASLVDPWGASTVKGSPPEIVIPQETEELAAPTTPATPRSRTAPAAAGDIEGVISQLSDKTAEVKLAALDQVSRFPGERIWQQVEILAMDKNDSVREKARRLLKEHYGDDAVADLSSAALSIQQRATIDLSTAAMRLARGENGAVEDVDVTLSASQSGVTRSRSIRRPKGAGKTTVQQTPPSAQLSAGWPPWAVGAVLAAALLIGIAGVFKAFSSAQGGGQGGAPPVEPSVENGPGGSKLAQISRAKDLGKFIGIAVNFNGKVVEAKNQEARYVVQSPYGNIVVQFVRSLPKPPNPGDAVDVDGVLLGKTRDGNLLLRGRKLAAGSPQ